MITELIVLLSAVVVAFVVYWIFHEVMHLAIHGVVGLMVLFAAKLLFGLKFTITWLAIVICAIGGIYGALAIIVLNHLKIAFL